MTQVQSKRSVAIFIECENDAFGTTPLEMNHEVVKILEDFLVKFERTHVANASFNLTDINGNKVGYVIVNHGVETNA